jgi:hypothetical protein
VRYVEAALEEACGVGRLAQVAEERSFPAIEVGVEGAGRKAIEHRGGHVVRHQRLCSRSSPLEFAGASDQEAGVLDVVDGALFDRHISERSLVIGRRTSWNARRCIAHADRMVMTGRARIADEQVAPKATPVPPLRCWQ